MIKRQPGRWLVLTLVTGVFLVLVANTGWWETALKFLFAGVPQVVYPRSSLFSLVVEHLRMVAISSGLTVLAGLPLGVWVTRQSGRSFLPLVSTLTSFGQTFPPVAVLAIAAPLLGFGLRPTILALFLYGLLPVVHNTISGLTEVPAHVLEAAGGMGMSLSQKLFRVEIPLALPVIIAGVRTSVVINIGTAVIGAVIGAGGLGAPIIAGLVENNPAFVIEGALPAAMLAILADQLLSSFEKSRTVDPA